MERKTGEGIVDAVEDRADVEFRSAVHYRVANDGLTHDLLRVREDVRSQYGRDDREDLLREAVEDLALEELARPWHERLHGGGSLYYTARVFDETTVFHVGRDGGGLYLSVDNGQLPFADTLLAETKDRLG